MIVNVYGSGIRCSEAAGVMREALQAAGCTADIRLVSDPGEMQAAGVVAAPAVAVDGTLICSGRIPSKEEAEAWLASPACCGGRGCDCR